jgi:oligopeptide transport system ATP-binding protein
LGLLDVQGLEKIYGHGRHAVPAVRGIDLTIARGETVALVGESGCGKSSTARVVAGLTGATAGELALDGEELVPGAMVGETRRRVQMVFQHPEQSLNPRMTVAAILREPLKLLCGTSGREADAAVTEALRTVGLGPEHAPRRPRELSGGQQQRVAIARALIVDPELVVLDEPTASLDQSIRARIVSLLRDLQERTGVGYLFISHDLTVVRALADRVAVMYLGRIVETAPTGQLFDAPRHPYTQALLAAAPVMDPHRPRRRAALPGETPSPSSLPAGCSFQDRCPLVHDRCRTEAPELLPLERPDHEVECFAVTSGLSSPAGTPGDARGGGR